MEDSLFGYVTHPRKWHDGGYHRGMLLRVPKEPRAVEYINRRMGLCWMAGRLLPDDLIVCVEHAGDAFWRCALVEGGPGMRVTDDDGRKVFPAYRIVASSTFAMYACCPPANVQANEIEQSLLLSGKWTNLSA